MGMFGFVAGVVCGAVFIGNMDDYYYKTLKRNVADPVSIEFQKTEVDLVQISKLISSGLTKSYKDLYP
jgi:hypothetical protein